jgi:Uma2 family endonuclease
VLSSSNTEDEMREKMDLYFEKGACEVWICENGVMRFYNVSGEQEKSVFVPEFPGIVEIDV